MATNPRSRRKTIRPAPDEIAPFSSIPLHQLSITGADRNLRVYLGKLEAYRIGWSGGPNRTRFAIEWKMDGANVRWLILRPVSEESILPPRAAGFGSVMAEPRSNKYRLNIPGTENKVYPFPITKPDAWFHPLDKSIKIELPLGFRRKKGPYKEQEQPTTEEENGGTDPFDNLIQETIEESKKYLEDCCNGVQSTLQIISILEREMKGIAKVVDEGEDPEEYEKKAAASLHLVNILRREVDNLKENVHSLKMVINDFEKETE